MGQPRHFGSESLSAPYDVHACVAVRSEEAAAEARRFSSEEVGGLRFLQPLITDGALALEGSTLSIGCGGHVGHTQQLRSALADRGHIVLPHSQMRMGLDFMKLHAVELACDPTRPGALRATVQTRGPLCRYKTAGESVRDRGVCHEKRGPQRPEPCFIID